MEIRETSVFTRQVQKLLDLRVIYYWARKDDVILLLLIYGKNQQENLTPEQRAVLKRVIREEYP